MFHIFTFFRQKKEKKKKKKEKKRKKKIFDLKKHFLNWKPNAGYPTGAKPKRKKRKKRKKKKKRRKKRKQRKKKEKKKKKKTRKKRREKKKKHVTVLQFVPKHRYAIHVWKIVPRNHAVVIYSDIFHMFMVHVVFTCLWFMLNGLERFCHFFVGVSTQSPLPSSCLEYGGLQCSHIFIIRCVFYCFHSWFISFPGAFNVLFMFIYVHLCSFMFIYFHFFSFFFMSCSFSLLKKPLPI